MKIGELAKRLGVPGNTLRYWCKEYEQFLTPGAQAGLGAVRNLTEQDALILATVADLRNKGISKEQIVTALEEKKLIDVLPNTPNPDQEAAQKSVALIPIAELNRALDQIRVMQTEIERLVTERDKALISREDANERIAQLSKELGRARGIVYGAIALVVFLVIVLIAIFVLFVRYLPAPG